MKTRAAGRSSSPGWTPDLGSGLIVACSLVLAAAVVVGRGVAPAAAMLIVLSVLVAWHRWILTWHVLLCFLIAVVLFVPVGRYSMAINLPFGLELYRIAVALVLLVWVASLLVDPRVRLRRTPLDAPVALIVAASLGSVAVNYGRVAPLAAAVLKGVTLFLSFIILFYFISSVVTTAAGVVSGHEVHRVRRRCRRVLLDRRAEDGVQRLRSCSERLPVPAIRRVDNVDRDTG